ncbi:SPOR domain-containing protein [uncultured Bacteroides sp.]|uniref:SPOR domain-containing protein n=1 Tax=uncultured Bacteroides sp. TaxID=162156 RepID=UPI0037495892
MKTNPIYLVLLFCCLVSLKMQAQNNIIKSLEHYEAGCGTITIHQDSRLDALLGVRHINTGTSGETKVLKESGFRIQVYAGGDSRDSKSSAYEMSGHVKALFPELSVYILFQSPRWLCQVGDYKTMEEAYAMMRKMKQAGAFNEASIVRSQIIIPL